MKLKRYACNSCGADIADSKQSKVIFQAGRSRRFTCYVCISCREELIKGASKSRRASILAIMGSANSEHIMKKKAAVAT